MTSFKRVGLQKAAVKPFSNSRLNLYNSEFEPKDQIECVQPGIRFNVIPQRSNRLKADRQIPTALNGVIWKHIKTTRLIQPIEGPQN